MAVLYCTISYSEFKYSFVQDPHWATRTRAVNAGATKLNCLPSPSRIPWLRAKGNLKLGILAKDQGQPLDRCSWKFGCGLSEL